ncbi:MAG: chromosomal replication initiator protein DnaA [Solirubrobacterales bacterium]|nr:chromosomal replication initiator protein DnaA [Solirubrobacterales bacterium]
MTQDLSFIWPAVQDLLRRTLSESTFEVWIAPLRPLAIDGPVIRVGAPPEIRDWVADRFAAPLDAAARAVLGAGASVDLVPDRPGAIHPSSATPGAPTSGHVPSEPDVELNPKFTFGQFVIGDANRFAHAAALAVAELPGQAYNPLFIYGPPGVGKTHLLHSIAAYVREFGAGLTARYTTVERFTNAFVASLRGDASARERFKEHFRRVDVLLIDDVQFLQKKTKTEEEFFHTFNALRESGSQLVLTSDCLPRDLRALEDRMRERFESGLVTDIKAPDPATRTTVLRKRVQHDGVRLAEPAALEVIAERIPTNIRALEGALIRVVAFGSLTGRPITAALATEVLDGLYGPQEPRRIGGTVRGGPGFGLREITVESVQEIVCESFGLSRDELVSASRTARVTWPRHVAMYLAREHTQESLPAIGQAFGGRNHTTVMHAVRKTTERLADDPEAFRAVQKLSARLTGA